ncbi:hypothetical protein LWC35_12145 [Pseudonocardia kujensis]|uniref:hypothetical protein n=1 Tax=Pseudonocardia kujensis TaxID=1128675 RepID=UPI001E476B33|nr:hypothetical protein [Pseudonocardia kujensis]MCE0763650.1 hypothetical protein [Pseudonocardia kujensis]
MRTTTRAALVGAATGAPDVLGPVMSVPNPAAPAEEPAAGEPSAEQQVVDPDSRLTIR